MTPSDLHRRRAPHGGEERRRQAASKAEGRADATWRTRGPLLDWHELSGRQRRQVARCARRGRPHRDDHVAAVARAWAEQVPDVARPWSRRQRVRAAVSWLPTMVFLAVAVALQLDEDPGFTSNAFTDWRERRLARRILALPPS